MHILLTGSTGYIGNLLVSPLLEAGHVVRCLARRPERLVNEPWASRVEIVEGDVLRPDSLDTAFDAIDAAFYLVHSMGSGEKDFAERDRQAALNFAGAAERSGTQRIIYLGGISPKGGASSKHLTSRLDTGTALRSGRVPVTEFRAGAVIGSGSFSFELVRYLTERVPLMTTPRWVHTLTQPIAVDDVVAYLVAALDTAESAGLVIEIGGRDVLTYGDMIRRYAALRGLRRLLVPVPFLTPRLSSRWVGFISPLDVQVARPLIDGLESELVADAETALSLFDIAPMGYDRAVELALQRPGTVEGWRPFVSAGASTTEARGSLLYTYDREGLLGEVRSLPVKASSSRVFDLIQSLGGNTGWLHADRLWTLRGVVDRLLGGPGRRRSDHPSRPLRPGDAMDFWRVEAVEPDRTLLLRAEMKLPGRAWLHYEVEPDGASSCTVTQASVFEPKGLLGLVYWHAARPLHRYVFSGMLEALRRRAEADGAPGSS